MSCVEPEERAETGKAAAGGMAEGPGVCMCVFSQVYVCARERVCARACARVCSGADGKPSGGGSDGDAKAGGAPSTTSPQLPAAITNHPPSPPPSLGLGPMPYGMPPLLMAHTHAYTQTYTPLMAPAHMQGVQPMRGALLQMPCVVFPVVFPGTPQQV